LANGKRLRVVFFSHLIEKPKRRIFLSPLGQLRFENEALLLVFFLKLCLNAFILEQLGFLLFFSRATNVEVEARKPHFLTVKLSLEVINILLVKNDLLDFFFREEEIGSIVQTI
jgi:hypothetical protein